MNIIFLMLIVLVLPTSTTASANSETILVVSSASYIIQPVAPDSLATAYSSGFIAQNSAQTVTAWIVDSAGREFTLDTAALVRHDQINFHVPPDAAIGNARMFVRNNPTGVTQDGSFTIRKTSPGFFTANANGFGVPAAVVLRIKPDGSRVYETLYYFDRSLNRFEPSPIEVRNSPDTVYLILFGTGWRNHDKPATPRVSIGRTEIIPQYLGAQGDFPGLDQVNVLLPRNLREGKDLVKLSLGCLIDTQGGFLCLETQADDVAVLIS